MKTILFAPETFNIAETTRMIEIAKAARENFNCEFFGYSDIYSKLIEQAGFKFHRMEPWLTPQKIEHLWKVDRMESLADPQPEQEGNIAAIVRYGSAIKLSKRRLTRATLLHSAFYARSGLKSAIQVFCPSTGATRLLFKEKFIPQ